MDTHKLARIRDYCDEQAGIALHDPEGTPNKSESEDWQLAASTCDKLKESR